jgi:hypothetical protein
LRFSEVEKGKIIDLIRSELEKILENVPKRKGWRVILEKAQEEFQIELDINKLLSAKNLGFQLITDEIYEILSISNKRS